MSTGPLVPAAQYLRMSTEHQQYSLDNQSAAIQRYADAHNSSIAQTFSDAGKSGLQLKHRARLSRLLQEVVSGGQPYKAILVYDVSRWGRSLEQHMGAGGHALVADPRVGLVSGHQHPTERSLSRAPAHPCFPRDLGPGAPLSAQRGNPGAVYDNSWSTQPLPFCAGYPADQHGHVPESVGVVLGKDVTPRGQKFCPNSAQSPPTAPDRTAQNNTSRIS